MHVDVGADDVGTCPACGKDAISVAPFVLPVSAEDLGGLDAFCLVPARPGEHYPSSTHQDYRPDVLAIVHTE